MTTEVVMKIEEVMTTVEAMTDEVEGTKDTRGVAVTSTMTGLFVHSCTG